MRRVLLVSVLLFAFLGFCSSKQTSGSADPEEQLKMKMDSSATPEYDMEDNGKMKD